ncbi:MAG: UDP-N-acetylmuramoyl-L-alanine--D-glutamate ligase [Caldilineales bacterium]|nr:UDP-N-acetylmuramoyl-L-alanine--D-glutamate ligase [Caldilineales bacterium]
MTLSSHPGLATASSADFSGQKLLVVGLAREGLAAARWLAAHGASLVLSDLHGSEALDASLSEMAGQPGEVRIGPQTAELLDGIDAVVVSPGVPQTIPLLQEARRRHIPLTAETRLFAQFCPAPIVGITGSSGKTTTSTLTARMLEAAGFQVWLGGNVGTPLSTEVERMQPGDRVVMELSSFQLPYWAEQESGNQGSMPWHDSHGLSPHVTAILNITPNHLDRHPSMSHYTAAKSHILNWQTATDYAVLNRDDPMLAAWAESGRVSVEAGAGQEAFTQEIGARILTFGLESQPARNGSWLSDGRIWLRWQGQAQPVIDVTEIRLRGRHNLANVAAACCLAKAAGADIEAMAEAIRQFTGVAHRLEIVRVVHGVTWINDSIATSPKRAQAALRSFSEPIILLAGGRDKHLPWDDWATLVHGRVRHAILFGEAAGLIEAALHPTPPDSQLQSIQTCADLPQAVALAHTLTQPGDVVLLSPGGTSYDSYVDFAERGQHFRDLVNVLAD